MLAQTVLADAPAQLAIAAIGFYQRQISPYKGFCCAHRVRYGRHSCSQWIKRAIARRGLGIGVLLAKRRFANCRAAASLDTQLPSRWETEEDRRQANQKKGGWCSTIGAGKGNAGQCDGCCAACDIASCGCDIFNLFN